MSGVNRAILIGNLGKDPEVKTMQSGKKVVNFSVATSRTWRDRETGERKEATQWHRVVVFSEVLIGEAERLRKGSKVYVEGSIETRKWESDSGDKYFTEIVLRPFGSELVSLHKRGSGDMGQSEHNYDDGETTEYQPPHDNISSGRRPARNPDLDDDIPF